MGGIISTLAGLLSGTKAANGYTPVPGGWEGEILQSQLHGQKFHHAINKRLYLGTTAIAGTIVPVNASALVGTFTLLNPPGSGVNLEILRYRAAADGTTTAVIGSVDLAYQANPNVFTTGTLAGITNCLIGTSTTGKGQLYDHCTFAGTPTLYGTLGVGFGTTGMTPGPDLIQVEFDGELIVPPNVAITVVGNAAQTQPLIQSILWAEVPV